MNDEELLIKLRDCFTAGYTLPQFCIDNNIKRPLIVAEGKFALFLWELYVQFHYDKRLFAQFAFLDTQLGGINFSAHNGVLKNLNIPHISQVNLQFFEAVICITTKKFFSGGKVIYLDALTDYFIRKAYTEIPLLNFLQRYPKVKLFLTTHPSINRYKGGAKFESKLFDVGEFTARLRNNKNGNIQTALDKFGYTNAQILEFSDTPTMTTNHDGSTVMKNTDENSLLRIRNGKRVTAYQPARFRNRIYFFGNCVYFGIYAPFDKTIESHLQKMLNENNLPYRVENESQFVYGRTQDTFYNLNKLEPAPGDIIFVFVERQRATDNRIPFFDVSDAFDPPHDYRNFFCVKRHYNELGYKILAEKYFSFLTANNFFREVELKYSAPPQAITDMVYRRNTNRTGRQAFQMRSWRLTRRRSEPNVCRSGRWL